MNKNASQPTEDMTTARRPSERLFVTLRKGIRTSHRRIGKYRPLSDYAGINTKSTEDVAFSTFDKLDVLANSSRKCTST
jgi:hypothetical protein